MADKKVFKPLTFACVLKTRRKQRKTKKCDSNNYAYEKLHLIVKLSDPQECYEQACNIGNLHLMDVIQKNNPDINLKAAFITICKKNDTGILLLSVADWIYGCDKNIINDSDVIKAINESSYECLRLWMKTKVY